jgi:hypothetical protein
VPDANAALEFPSLVQQGAVFLLFCVGCVVFVSFYNFSVFAGTTLILVKTTLQYPSPSMISSSTILTVSFSAVLSRYIDLRHVYHILVPAEAVFEHPENCYRSS